MPFDRPSLREIVDRIESDFETRISGAGSLLRRSVLKVMARVFGGVVHLLYGFLDYQAEQLQVLTADSEGLDNAASEYGRVRRSSVKAQGSANGTGMNGTVIPEGTELQNSDGIVYLTDEDVTIAGGVFTVDLTAEVAGADGNEDAGATLNFVSPIAQVTSTVTIDANGITGGTDEETDDSLRARVLARKRMPPHGGAEFDYEAWALEVSGVTRVWTIPLYQGIGTIAVIFVRDGDTNIFPTEEQRQTVKDYIISHDDPGTGLPIGCPVTAEPGLFVLAPEPLTVDFSIDIYPNTAEVRAAIETQLETLLYEEGGPEETIYLSRVQEAISLAVGEERHRLNSPIQDVTTTATQIHTLGTITWGSY